MAITGRTPTVVELASATSITGTLPTDRQAGDITIAIFEFATPTTTPTLTPPSGWTALYTPSWFGTSNTVTLAAYYQFNASTAPTASHNGTVDRCTVICQSYGGVDTTTPIDVAAALTSVTGTSLTATGVTTVTAGALLLSAYGGDASSRAVTYPSGMTGVAQYAASGTGGRMLALAQEARPTAGASGTRVWTMTPAASVNSQAFVIALRPASTIPASATLPSTFALTATAVVGSVAVLPSTFGLTATARTDGVAGTTIGSTFALTAVADVQVVAASTPITCRMEIEFAAGVWTDVTQWVAYRAGPVTIRQGRPTPYDEIAPGVLSCALWNDDGRFMPDNSASPYWPNVVTGKRIRWLVEKAGTTYTRFAGWIQALRPTYPGTSTNDAIVGITAVDGLGRLTMKRMRSNFSETAMWRAREDAVTVDAYEASGRPTGLLAVLTNYSTNVGRAAGAPAYNASFSTLSFGTDQDASIGGVASSSGDTSCKTIARSQASPLQWLLHLKGPSALVPTTSNYAAASFHTLNEAAQVCHLSVRPNGALNGLFLRNSGNSADLGIIANLPMGQWVRVQALSRSDNPARSDWFVDWQDGATGSALSNVAIDVRTIRSLEIPGAFGPSLSGAWGGIAALGTRTTLDVEESFVGGSRAQILRLQHFASSTVDVGVTLTAVGTFLGNVSTGTWSDRSAADVLQEIMRTYHGLAWVWPVDENVYAFESGASGGVYPDIPLVTIDLDGDCQGTPRLSAGVETRPTRIEVEWPGGTEIAYDATAEAAGQQRPKRITTVSPSAAIAKGLALSMLERAVDSRATRIEQITVSLMSSRTDHAPALFGESAPELALFPTQRIRTIVPLRHFGVPTLDHHVEGWTETYSPDDVTLTLDTTPAVASDIRTETFTGANAAAWSSLWVAAFGPGNTGATVDIQGNRGRIVSGAGGMAGRRLGLSVADVEVSGLAQVQGTAEAQIWWRAAPALANGYGLVFSVAGGIRVQQSVSSTFTTRYSAATIGGPAVVAGTDYRFRIRHLGKYFSLKVWAASSSEPGAWNIHYTDTLHASGDVALSQWYATQTAYFDDLTITTGA